LSFPLLRRKDETKRAIGELRPDISGNPSRSVGGGEDREQGKKRCRGNVRQRTTLKEGREKGGTGKEKRRENLGNPFMAGGHNKGWGVGSRRGAEG